VASPRLRGLAFVALSLAGHGALVAGVYLPGRRTPPAAVRGIGGLTAVSAARVARAARIAEERALLVATAREDLRAGRLALGDFLLRANALDAEERGAPIDLDAARALYRARVDALRASLARGALRDAVPQVLVDLRYFGRPGGLLAQALFDRGGSCEQLSQLIAAAAHDAGLPGRVALRFYGGAMSDGTSHVTAVDGAGAEEIDLVTGRPALRGGARFPAADLIEAYARVHGLAPPLPGGGHARGGAAADAEPERPSLSAGYPPNDDRYPGTLPLFAARAVADPDDDEGTAEASALEARSRAHDCAFFVRLAALDPPAIEIEPGGLAGGLRMELRRIPTPAELERRAALLRGAEEIAAGEHADPVDRVMAQACLAALGRDIAADFALAGEHELASLALAKGRAAREAGGRAIAEAAWESPSLRRRLSVRFAGQTWLLLFLEGGDRIVLDLARPTESGADWGQVDTLAALLVAPATRARAYAMVDALPREVQVDVMHEIFHAQDRLRPWASNYAPDDGAADAPEGRAFRAAYRVFRRLASRFWEGQRPVDQTLAALARESREARLDAGWEALFLSYYGRNLLGLHQNRPVDEVVPLLRQAVGERRHPALDVLRRRLDEVEARGRIGPQSVL
jgi:hypothetical protein